MRKPVNSWKNGGMNVAAWPNDRGITFTLKKSYKDKSTGEWKEAKSFFRDEIVALRDLLSQAIAWSGDEEEHRYGSADQQSFELENKIKAEKKAAIAKTFEDDDIPF